jgi:hypothetical protein
MKTLTTRFICDYNSILTAELLSMTDKFATIKIYNEIKKCKIYTSKYDGAKYIFPLGKYSMAPTFDI